MSLSWTTALPSTYVHNLLVDTIPAPIPFEVTQTPLCGAALTFLLTDSLGVIAPTWIYPVSETHLELNANILSQEGYYSL